MYRQGDVILLPVTEIPTDLKSDTPDKVILAYGEVTGHHHRFEDGNVLSFFKEGDDMTMSGGSPVGQPTSVAYVEVPDEGATLKHEEHSPIPVPAGKYKVVRQREYVAPNIQRAVAD